MASNPMQRRAKLYFLLGAVFMLLIAAVVVFFMYKKTEDLNKQIDELKISKKNVAVLTQDVKSGFVLTSDMFQMKEVDKNSVPEGVNGATSDIASLLSQYSLCDEDGNPILSEIKDGKQLLYLEKDNQKLPITIDEETGKYYSQSKEIKTTETPVVAKIDMNANTVVTGTMLARSDEITTDDLREQTYNMIALPIDLESGEYVDIRLMLPNGNDFIVLSKVKVTIPDASGTPMADTIKINISEDDLLTLSSSIVEAYKIEGSKLYAIKYVEPGNQSKAYITYKPKDEIIDIIKKNPNVVEKAKENLAKLWNGGVATGGRGQIDAYDRAGENEKVTSGIQESTEATQQAREEYLTSLYGGTTDSSSGSSSTSE